VEIATRCARCDCTLSKRPTFQFETVQGLVFKCPACAIRHWPMLRRSLTIASIVGSVLTAINQGDILLRGPWPAVLFWKIPLTYSVPFTVATVSALLNARSRRARPATP
jgi:hypothetical protein